LIGSLRPDGEPRSGRLHGRGGEPPVQRPHWVAGAQRVRSRGRCGEPARRAPLGADGDVEVEEDGRGGLRARAPRAPAGVETGRGAGREGAGHAAQLRRDPDRPARVCRRWCRPGSRRRSGRARARARARRHRQRRAADHAPAPRREERRQGNSRRGRGVGARERAALRRHSDPPRRVHPRRAASHQCSC
jgi:hypothetical protein